jgi:hypothetical protein
LSPVWVFLYAKIPTVCFAILLCVMLLTLLSDDLLAFSL